MLLSCGRVEIDGVGGVIGFILGKAGMRLQGYCQFMLNTVVLEFYTNGRLPLRRRRVDPSIVVDALDVQSAALMPRDAFRPVETRRVLLHRVSRPLP